MSETQKLSCKVTRVFFPKEEFTDGRRHFVIANTTMGKVKGELPFYPREGTRLVLDGRYEVHNGSREFRFFRADQDVPVDPHALLDYAATLSKGVGPKAVEKIWAKYGADWRNNLDDMAPSISIPLTRTVNALMSNRDRLELTMFCIQHGGSPSIAEKAWSAWNNSAVAVIRENPWLLSRLDGIGFKTADEFARKLGVNPDGQKRAIAAVDYIVADLMASSGNSVVSRDAMYKLVDEYGVSSHAASIAIAKLVRSGRIQFVGMDMVTTSQVVEHEGDIVRYAHDASKYTTTDFAPVFPEGFTPDEAQISAVRNAVNNPGLTIINGGAGAGKTTIVKAIADTIEKIGGRVSLCAFAGKAAARLREATGHDASTIHSMLGWTGDGRGFSQGNLEGITVIVDEASMIPSSLLFELTKRNPSRLILVGDQAQLQPVGIGAPFHDLIDMLPSAVNTLTTCYRNKEAVFANALRIRNGLLPENSESRNEKFQVVEASGPEAAHNFIADRAMAGDIDFAQDIVLAPRNGEGEEPAPCTVKSLNATLQSIVNPHPHGEKFVIDDRVMCVKNFSSIDVWNGTTGTISRIDTDGRPWFMRDEGGEVLLREKEQVANIVPAYCLTVHKSQGSQYRDVYVCCLKRDGAILMDRSMLYTAVTRARRACYIVCDSGVDRIVNSMHRRNTYLKTIFAEAK